jgi:hypothetical protein
VRDLLVLLYQIQTFGDNGIILEFVFPDLHKDFNHVLHSVTNRTLVQDGPEAFEDRCISLWGVLSEECANFAHEADSNFDRVIGRSFEEQYEDLKSNDFVGNLLVDQVS